MPDAFRSLPWSLQGRIVKKSSNILKYSLEGGEHWWSLWSFRQNWSSMVKRISRAYSLTSQCDQYVDLHHSPAYLHPSISSSQHIFIPAYLHLILSSSPLIFILSYLHPRISSSHPIFIPAYLHLILSSSPHIFISSYLHPSISSSYPIFILAYPHSSISPSQHIFIWAYLHPRNSNRCHNSVTPCWCLFVLDSCHREGLF